MATEVAEQQREERPDEGRSLSPARRTRRCASVAFVGGAGRRSSSSAGSPSTSCATRTRTGSSSCSSPIVVGVGGVFALFWAMDRVVDWLPERLPRGRAAVRVRRARARDPRVFLVYPVINTILISFKDAQRPELGRARQLQVRVHRREHAAVDPQHGGLGHRRPARRGERRARCSPRSPIGCAAARRSRSR